MNYRLSFTDTAIISVFGGIYIGILGMGTTLVGIKVIEKMDYTIYPRTPEYLANKKREQLVSWIKGDDERIKEKELVLEGLKKYKDSGYKSVTEKDIKFEIEYLKRSIERWKHEKEVLDFAFILPDEPVALMPVGMGFRKLFYGL
jgi:hypothetical protein